MEPHASEGRNRPATPLARAALGVLIATALAIVVWTAVDRGARPGPGDGAAGSSTAAPMEPRPVPPFRFTDQDGKPFGLDDLKGKVWIGNFMFSRCSATCPGQAVRMGEVARALANTPEVARNVRLISFSVDSKNDTPEVLKAYAESQGAPAEMWRFLGGPGEEVAKLSRDGFQLGAAVAGETGEGFAHSDRFVLVDAEGMLRGYFRPTTEPGDMDRLLAEVRRLAAGK
jgi:protein SCO1